jgi:tripartite-type tricarboxylate transporter receptor subunit TctC
MRPLIVASFAAAASIFTSFAGADDYPSHPIRLIVPFSAGGGADVVARIIAEQVGTTIGQPIIVENKAGAAAIIGTESVAKATPDGYTLLLGQSGPISINPAVYESLQYDPVKDFAPITLTTAYPYILVVNAKEPQKSLKELVATIKQSPNALNYGSAGIGGANHLVTEMFSEAAGLKMTHIPYRGTAPAVADLLAGRLTLVFSDPVSALAHIQSGALRALAVSSKERSAIAPDVPTVAESGYPGFDAIGWHGILAPASTSPAVIRKLHDEIVKALHDPHTKSLLTNQATQVVGDTPAEFAGFIQDDIAKWSAIAKHANISVK